MIGQSSGQGFGREIWPEKENLTQMLKKRTFIKGLTAVFDSPPIVPSPHRLNVVCSMNEKKALPFSTLSSAYIGAVIENKVQIEVIEGN